MKTNLSSFDGWFRTLLFIVSICYAIMAGGTSWLWIIPTGILFVTAVLGWCPIYEMLGLNTEKEKEKSHS